MKLKTFPKVVIGLVVLGVAGFFLSKQDLSKLVPPKKVEVVEQQPAQDSPPVVQQQEPVQQDPPAAQPAPQPAQPAQQDAGLAAVLGKKK
jgi:hypothetical protein